MDRYRYIPIILLVASLLVLLSMVLVKVLSPASPSGPDPIPTDDPAELVEVTPSPAPTETPLPNVTVTLEPTSTIFVPTHTPNPKDLDYAEQEPPEGCNVAGFISDVTAPDGTEVDRRVYFTKTWRLQNDGTCIWTDDYKIYFVSGDQMSGPKSQPLTEIDVPPGTTIDVSVVLKAPKDPGKYKGYWGLKDGGGFPFGISTYKNPFYVKIIVK